LNREASRAKADLIIFSSSIAILHGSPMVHAQLLAMAQLRAATLGKPIAFAANGGYSFIVNHRGDILWQNNTTEEQYAIISISVPKP
jgi:apolipoprotein N-acyltransferase